MDIDTLSYKDGAKAVHWECDGGTEYDMEDTDKDTVGTTITLHLNEDCNEFSNEYRAREIIEKYCSFMPYEIFLENADDTEQKTEIIEKDELQEGDVILETIVEPAKTKEIEDEDGNKKEVETAPATERLKIVKRPVSLSDTKPLWTKHPNECSEDEYKEFYRKVFRDYKEPLFWIHLNMDYPFNLKGILYFPKINLEFESAEGVIKLYNNQVFVADNIKEVIPEFLMLLKGVIDCPDLPLNVSRSALQNDGFVRKISDYITKKVADKLSGMCKTEKESYEKYWDDISPFIKFGCLKDEKFCEKMNDYVLFKNLEGKYLTLPEYRKNEDDSLKEKIFYVKDEVEQGQYIKMFKEAGLDAVILDNKIDQAFISQLEQKNDGLKFLSIDSDLSETFKEEDADEETVNKLSEIFKKALNNESITIKVEKLKDAEISSMITINEESKRMMDMMKMYAMNGFDPAMMGGSGDTLVLNANNSLVQYILNNPDSENINIFCEQLYDLALVGHGSLSPEQMTGFIARSNKIMSLLAK